MKNLIKANTTLQFGWKPVTTKFDVCNTASSQFFESDLKDIENNDCAVRALATAFDISYEKAHSYCAKHFNRKRGQGTLFYQGLGKMIANKTQLNGKKVHKIYASGMASQNKYIENLDPKKLVKDFNCIKTSESLKLAKNKTVAHTKRIMSICKKGTFIVLIKGHTFTIKDGVIYGNLNDALNDKEKAHNVYQIK